MRTSCEDIRAKPAATVKKGLLTTLRTGHRLVQWQAEASVRTLTSAPVSGYYRARLTSLQGSRLILDFGNNAYKLISG